MIETLIARLSSVHSNHKRVAAGALLIGALTLVAKLFVAGREMAIAWRYGVSATVDAYQLALTITTWLPMMLAGVMAVVLVPRLVTLDRQGGSREQFVAELNGSVLIVGLAVLLLTWLAAPAAATLLASRTEERTLQLTAAMAAEMAPIALFMIVSGYLFARLQSRERYGYSVTEALPAIAIALFVIVPLGLGATPLIVGTLAGFLLQLVVLAALVKRGDPPVGGARISHRSDQWATLYGSILLMISGQLLMTATIPIDQWFAARLGEGAVATLGYANRIVTLFSGIATIVVGRALLPVLSGAAAEGDLDLGRRHTRQWAWLLGGAAAIGSVLLWIAAPLLVRLLFERGAFTAAASADVAGVFRWGLVQLPFYFAGIAFVQWIAVRGRYASLLVIAFLAVLLKVAMNLLLTQFFGLKGIMLATAGMYAFSFASQYLVAKR